MNWDSGLGFNRWHQGKKLGLTQEALVGLASSDSLLPGAQVGRSGRSRCSTTASTSTTRLAARSQDGLVGPGALRRDDGAAGRRQRPARRRAHPGQRRPRGRRRARQRRPAATPPPLYAYDPDIGRLAVTTPDVQHRDRRRQPERVPVRRPRPRAAVRRPAGSGGEHRRAPAGLVRPAGARRRPAGA